MKFGGANHVEQGGEMLGVKNAHHATANESEKIAEIERQEVRD